MTSTLQSTLFLRGVLLVAGMVMVLLGVNVGLGGIRTLGFQGPTDFLSVTNATAFAAQDSHVRFLGGFWLAAGAVVVAGAFALGRLRPALITIACMAFVGGLVRLSDLDPTVLMTPAIAPPLLAELLFYPALAVWLVRTP